MSEFFPDDSWYPRKSTYVSWFIFKIMNFHDFLWISRILMWGECFAPRLLCKSAPSVRRFCKTNKTNLENLEDIDFLKINVMGSCGVKCYPWTLLMPQQVSLCVLVHYQTSISDDFWWICGVIMWGECFTPPLPLQEGVPQVCICLRAAVNSKQCGYFCILFQTRSVSSVSL